MKNKQAKKIAMTVLAWLVAGAVFFLFPHQLLAVFKSEIDAVSVPPKLFFAPTLDNYVAVSQRADYFKFAWNSVAISVGSTIWACCWRSLPPTRCRSSLTAHQGHAAVDAVDQDDAGGGRAGADIYLVPR
jgi:hypothetical protein